MLRVICCNCKEFNKKTYSYTQQKFVSIPPQKVTLNGVEYEIGWCERKRLPVCAHDTCPHAIVPHTIA